MTDNNSPEVDDRIDRWMVEWDPNTDEATQKVVERTQARIRGSVATDAVTESTHHPTSSRETSPEYNINPSSQSWEKWKGIE